MEITHVTVKLHKHLTNKPSNSLKLTRHVQPQASLSGDLKKPNPHINQTSRLDSPPLHHLSTNTQTTTLLTLSKQSRW